MWQFLALIFICIGVLFVYSTNKNQGFFGKPLAKKWRIIGYIFWLISLVIYLQSHVFSAAFFIWFFTLSTSLVCIPLLSLLINPNKKSNIHKGSTL